MNMHRVQHRQPSQGQGLRETIDPLLPFSLPPDGSPPSQDGMVHILHHLHDSIVLFDRAHQYDHNDILQPRLHGAPAIGVPLARAEVISGAARPVGKPDCSHRVTTIASLRAGRPESSWVAA